MKEVCRSFILALAFIFLSCGGVSGSRWFSGELELSFEDSSWMLFDNVEKFGEKGEFREREGYLLLSIDEVFDSNAEEWRPASEKRKEYLVTINGHKLYLDKQDGKDSTVFLKT